MKERQPERGSAGSLRERAEAALTQTRGAIAQMSTEEVQSLVHELEVHQIELQLQNEELRRAQLDLEEARDRYLDLYDFAPVGYVTLDPMGVILEANLTATKLLRIDRKDLIGEKLSHFVPASEQDTLHLHIQRVLSTVGKHTCEIRLRAPDDTRRHLHLESVAVEEEEGTHRKCRTAVSDVTGLKQAKDEAVAGEARFRSLTQSAPVGVFQADADGGGVYVNEAVCRFTERAAEDHFGDRWAEAVHRDDREAVLNAWREAIDGGGDFDTEFRFVAPDGRVTWVSSQAARLRDASGRTTGFIGTLTDITERKRAERGLEASEVRHRSVVEDMPGLLCRFEPGGVITFVNAACADFVGKKPEELIGSTLFDFLAHEDRARVKSSIDSLTVDSPTQAVEHRAVAPSGEICWQRWTNRALFDGEGRVVAYQAFGEDITERKQAEEELQEREAEVQALVETSKDWIWAIDAQCRHTYSSPAIETILGYDPDELIGRSSLIFMHDEDRQRVEALMPEWIGMKSGWNNLIIRWRHKNGEYRCLESNAVPILDARGEVIGFRGVDRDITERKVAEEELRKFKTISDQASYGAAIADSSGSLLYVNDTFAKMHDYRVEELIGGDLSVFHSEQQLARVNELNECLLTHGSFSAEEVWHSRRDGTEFPTLMNATVIADASGAPAYLSATAIDITERKHAEEELVRYREHLEELVKERTAELEDAHKLLIQQERLATLGRLTATVSHELRNPLGTIRASFYSIADETSDKELGIEDVLDRAERNITRCDAIIEELLDYARTKKPELSPTRVDDWLAHVLDEQTIPAGIRLKRSLVSGMEVPIDGERLRRCVINLVTNACQAMQEGKQTGGCLRVETARKADRLEIRIIDSGPGIPPERMEKIFEPLYSTKGFGVGLGLPIVRQIAEMHGGDIEIESEPGEGTRATLWLPLKHVEGARDEQVAYSSS